MVTINLNGVESMSHFYGSIPTSARKTIPTARGHESTGLVTKAASWKGAIRTELFVDDMGRDCYRVEQVSHQGYGHYRMIAEGVLGV